MNPGQAYSYCSLLPSSSNFIDSCLLIDLEKELVCFVKVRSIKLTREVVIKIAIIIIVVAFVEQPNSAMDSFTIASSFAGKF